MRKRLSIISMLLVAALTIGSVGSGNALAAPGADGFHATATDAVQEGQADDSDSDGEPGDIDDQDMENLSDPDESYAFESYHNVKLLQEYLGGKLTATGELTNENYSEGEDGALLITAPLASFNSGRVLIDESFNFDRNPVGRVVINALASEGITAYADVYLDDEAEPVASLKLRHDYLEQGKDTPGNVAIDVYGKRITGIHSVSIGFRLEGAADDAEQSLIFNTIEFAENSLPVVSFDINEQNGSIATMNESKDHSATCHGTVSIQVPEGYQSEYSDQVETGYENLELEYVRGRGNSTWRATKKPYKFKLKNGNNLFGMGRNKHWILLASFHDNSQMRNRMTYWLGEELGMAYTPQLVPVEVMMNDEYYGTYLLAEQVRIGDGRVEIDELDENDTDDPIITGGYLLSMNPYPEDPEENKFETTRGVKFNNEDPDFTESNNEAQKAYIRNYIQQTEDAVFGENFEDESGKSYKEYMDFDSTVDYWWVQEFSRNYDAYKTDSTFLYKKRSDKLYWGPLWDFDYVAWGSLEYDDDSIEGFNNAEPEWINHLKDDPEFAAALLARWEDFDAAFDEIIKEGGVLDKYYEEMKTGESYNHELWPYLFSTHEDYYDEVVELKNWVKGRKDWINDNLDLISHLRYSVTYYVDGEVYYQTRCNVGDGIGMRPDKPQKDDHVFIGWYTEDDELFPEMSTPEEDVNLYAKFVSIDEAIRPDKIFFSSRHYMTTLSSEIFGMEYKVFPEDTQYLDIFWESSNPDVADILTDEELILKGLGTTTITASLPNGDMASFELKVLEEEPEEAFIEEAHYLDDLYMDVGEVIQYLPAFVPEYYRGYISYEIDSDIAEVDDYGIIKALAPGTATLTATNYDNVETSCKVIIVDPNAYEFESYHNVKLGKEFENEMLQASGDLSAEGFSLSKGGNLLVKAPLKSFNSGRIVIDETFNFDRKPVGRASIDALLPEGITGYADIYLDEETEPFASFMLKNADAEQGESSKGSRTLDVYDKKLTGEHKVSIGFRLEGAEEGAEQSLILRTIEFAESSIPVLYFDIDESMGTIAAMNESSDHSVNCYGSVTLKVPEDYISEYTGEVQESLEGLRLDYIRGRGNSTWSAPKKPYKFKLSNGKDLFGMGKNKHWVLLASFHDNTQLHNRVTYWLGTELGMEYTPQLVPVELVMNGEYYGSYLLAEQVRVDKERVDIDEISDDVDSEPEITGGYLLGMNPNEKESKNAVFKTGAKMDFFVESPDLSESGNEVQKAYIEDYVQKTEDAIFGEDFKDSDGKSYKEYLDLDSAVDYWWIQELSMNGDAYVSGSTYLYKKREGKLYWGPLWDFDYVAWGGVEYNIERSDGFNNTSCEWMNAMKNDPEFTNALKARWPEIDTKLEEVTKDGGILDQYYDEMYIAEFYNHEIWDYMNSPLNDYKKEIKRFKNWINNRRAWINEHLEELLDLTYKVTLMADGKVVKEEVKLKGRSFDFDEPDAPKKEGYVFLYWSESENGERFNRDDISPDADFTLYAVYISEKDAIEAEQFYFNRKYIFGFLVSPDINLEFECYPTDAQLIDISWESSDESIAEPTGGNGLKLKKEGIVTITGTLRNGFKNSVTIKVVDGYPEYDDNLLKSAEFKKDLIITVGEHIQHLPEFTPHYFMSAVSYITDDDEVATVDDYGVVTGVAPGTTTLTLISYVDTNEYTCKVTVIEKWPFADIDKGSEFAGDILHAYDKGIINGFGKDDDGLVIFKPDKKLSRAQFAIMIYKTAVAQGIIEDGAKGSGSFSDMSEGMAGYDAVMWATENEIISGFKDGRFKPKNTVTKAQIKIMLSRYAEKFNADVSEFDFDAEMEATGLINDRDYADRAQCAIIIAKFLDHIQGK